MFKRVMTFANLAAALTFSAVNSHRTFFEGVDLKIDPRIAAGRKRSVLNMGSRNRYSGEDLRAIRSGTHALHGQAREMARRAARQPAKPLDPYRVVRDMLTAQGETLAGSDIGSRMIEAAKMTGAEMLKAYRALFITADGKPRADTYIPKRLRLAHPELCARMDGERARLAAA